MSNRSSIVALGESMALFAPADGRGLQETERLQAGSAGAEGNVATWLARLGHDVAWVSAVGDDPFGRRIVAGLRDAGVRTEQVRVDPERPTGVFFKDPASDGTTRVHYYRGGSAAAALGPADADTVRGLAPQLVHLTGITPALSASCAELIDSLVHSRAAGDALVSFDVNHRPALWRGRDAAAALRTLAAAADLVLVGRDEAQALWGTTDADSVRALLPQPGVLVVKDAEHGATAFEGDERVVVPAPAVEVVEPVGAGDAFAAGFLHGRLLGRALDHSLAAGHALAGVALSSPVDTPDPPPDLIARLTSPDGAPS